MKNKMTVSNILILISFIFTILATFYPNLYVLWVNTTFLSQWLYHIYIIQLFTWTFLHWWFFHFFANALFLYLFWNILELIMWRKKYIIFFIFIVFFNWIGLTLLDSWNTIWVSWFCMALISYYTLELKSKNNPDYKWWILALILNIWIWLTPWISLLGHLLWAIWWIIFYYLNKVFFQPRLVWLYNIEKS